MRVRVSSHRARFLCVLTVAIGCACADAASRTVTITTPVPLAKDVAALPQIRDASDAAERTINNALSRLDTIVRKAIAQCRRDGGNNADWERSVTVPMRGPAFVSFVITDSAFCGGAHPNTSTMAIVYDLATGRPVDWTKLLPRTLTGTVTLATGMDGIRTVALASPKLFALYKNGYRPASGSKKDIDEDRECRDAIAEAGDGAPPGMSAWLDAKENGLVLQFDLPHVVQACADSVVVPAAALREAGVGAPLLDALAAAHAARD